MLVSLGVALAEDAADEEMVDSGTMDPIYTITEGTLYTADQSVTGSGFANIYNNLVVVDPDDKSQVLNLKILTSGTGAYSHDSYVYVQNDSVKTYSGDFGSSHHNITAKDDISAVYSPVNLQFPGTFKVKRISNIAALAISRINYVFIFDLDSHRFGKSSFL